MRPVVHVTEKELRFGKAALVGKRTPQPQSGHVVVLYASSEAIQVWTSGSGPRDGQGQQDGQQGFAHWNSLHLHGQIYP